MILSKHRLPLADCELKFPADRRFEGYASVWDSVDSYGDTVARGAFKKTLTTGKMPKMFFGHSPGRPIGKWVSAEEDDRGLRVMGELTPGNSDSDNVYASLKHGALDGLSIGFYDRESEKLENGGRLLREIELVEISVVSLPAEERALVTSVKSAIESIETIRDAELFLRDAGIFSKSEAVAFVSRFKELSLRDADDELKGKFEAYERAIRTKDLADFLRTV